jgi:hypothetical protein
MEDTMSTYIDPATALTLARHARADEIRAAEQFHRSRAAKPTRPVKPQRPRWRIPRTRPAVAV